MISSAHDKYFLLSQDLLGFIDTDLLLHELNPQWERITGHQVHELENKQLINYIHPDDVDSTRQTITKLQKTTNVRCRLICKDGHYKLVEWIFFPDTLGVYFIGKDISEQNNQSQEIVASRILKQNQILAKISTSTALIEGNFEQEIRELTETIGETFQIERVSVCHWKISKES